MDNNSKNATLRAHLERQAGSENMVAPRSGVSYPLCIVCLLVSTISFSALGQTTAPVTSNVERSLEKISDSLEKTANPVIAPTAPQQPFAMDRIETLREVRLLQSLFDLDITNYWLPYFGKSVTPEDIQRFKTWLYGKLDDKGYVASIELKLEPRDDETALVISISAMRLGNIVVVTPREDARAAKLAPEVERRLSKNLASVNLLDVQELETQLTAISYDLPVDLDASIQSKQAGIGDVVIRASAIESHPGRFLNGALQANNYGVDQYGRLQLAAAVRVEGLSPLSVATVITQASEHVNVYRAEYETPLPLTRSRLRGWTGASTSSLAMSGENTYRNNADDIGIGLDTLLHLDRKSDWRLTTEWNQRSSRDVLHSNPSLETSKSIDTQIRLRLKSEFPHSILDSLTNEFIWISGVLELQNTNDLANDQDSYQRNGRYDKLEWNAGFSHALSRIRQVSIAGRVYGQWAAKNLSVYNRIAFGGSNGVRAYNSSEGNGDTGLGLSIEINRNFSNTLFAGLFYDVARYASARIPLQSEMNTNMTTLRGAGLQFGGSVGTLSWKSSIAKPIFDPSANDSMSNTNYPGNWRFNFELSRPF